MMRVNSYGSLRRIAALALGVLAFGTICTGPAAANEQSFDAWRTALRQEALSDGISAATFDTAFTGVQPIPRIVELDRSQPEFTMTFPEYLERVVPESADERTSEPQSLVRSSCRPFSL